MQTLNVRIIPRLDIKGPNLIKGIHLEGLRIMGNPHDFALNYYNAGADELLYMDVVASLYGRNNLSEIIRKASEKVFIPITVGGGIRSVDDASHILRSGADKVAINTAAILRPALINEISHRFGSQATVLSVEAKMVSEGKWEAYTDNGREKTGLDVIEWIIEGVRLGAGELLITSIDREGTRKGLDLDLIKQVNECVNIPVIASGGIGDANNFVEAVKFCGAGAIAIGDALHYGRETIETFREAGFKNNLNLRQL